MARQRKTSAPVPGTNAVDAHARLLRKEAELNAVNNGVMVVKEAKDGTRSLAGAVAEYLADVKLTHKPRSFAGARASTSHFSPTVHGCINVALRISATADEIQVSRLFNWPRTCDEDVHESPRALLPIRAGRHMGDAD